WSSPLPADRDAPMRYVDPMGGHKPHVLRTYRNNLGKEVSLGIKSSTWFRLQDERDGRPWASRLAFPVQCVRRVETRDLGCGPRLATEYRSHHGCYDAGEREFRGFGMVEQLDAQDVEHWQLGAGNTLVDHRVACPPTLTKTWFHTGTAGDNAALLAAYRDERWDAELQRAGLATPGSVPAEPDLPDGRLLALAGTPAGLVAG